MAGAVVAMLTYGGVFIAGARVAWIVHTLPMLPIASVVLALLPRKPNAGWRRDPTARGG